MQRKPGGYRKPTEGQRRLSKISKPDYDLWFRQLWTITGASTKEHPAPFPLELAYRLVRMFSFTGDVVLDPFAGTATTVLACMKSARNSVGVEIDAAYCRMAARRMLQEQQSMFSTARVQFEKVTEDPTGNLCVRESAASYGRHKRNRARTENEA